MRQKQTSGVGVKPGAQESQQGGNQHDYPAVKPTSARTFTVVTDASPNPRATCRAYVLNKPNQVPGKEHNALR